MKSGEDGRWNKIEKYPAELKREASNLAAEPGMSVAQVEPDLGITPGLIDSRRRQLQLPKSRT